MKRNTVITSLALALAVVFMLAGPVFAGDAAPQVDSQYAPAPVSSAAAPSVETSPNLGSWLYPNYVTELWGQPQRSAEPVRVAAVHSEKASIIDIAGAAHDRGSSSTASAVGFDDLPPGNM